MSKKIINQKKLTLDIDKLYKNDFNLLKTIAQTKKMRHNNKSLEIRKNKLKELMTEINNEYELNNNPSRKNLLESNATFHNEYKLFNKRTNKKDTKEIFKDLVKLYKSKGYKIPNFSINNHNLFKINPLLEVNANIISNGLIENQISHKKDDSEKIIKYLKKLGIILSGKMSNDKTLQRNIIKKFNLPKYKIVINEEDTIENLKKKIEIITNLINTNALSKLDEHKKRRFKNISRQNSSVSVNYNSNKKLFLLHKDKYAVSRRPSNYNNRVLKMRTTKESVNFFQERTKSNDSSASISSFISNNNYFNKKSNKEKSSENLNKIFNFTVTNANPGISFPKAPRTFNIPVLNLTNNNISNKQNNLFIINKRNSFKDNNQTILNYKGQINNNAHNNFNFSTNKKTKNNRYPFFIKTQSNNESNNNSNISDEIILDSRLQTDENKNNSLLRNKKRNDSYNSYPYTSRNEFINFAFNRFKKRDINDAEQYIRNYLTKLKGYDNDQAEIFLDEIYRKNIKNNIKDLEKQINVKDLYSKTERLYLNSHIIKRIKPLLNSMGERDKTIQRLEKNLTDAVSKK